MHEGIKCYGSSTREATPRATRLVLRIADRIPLLRTVECRADSCAEPKPAAENTPQALSEGKPGEGKKHSVSMDHRVTSAPRRIQAGKQGNPKLAGCSAPDRPPRGFLYGGLRPFASPYATAQRVSLHSCQTFIIPLAARRVRICRLVLIAVTIGPSRSGDLQGVVVDGGGSYRDAELNLFAISTFV